MSHFQKIRNAVSFLQGRQSKNSLGPYLTISPFLPKTQMVNDPICTKILILRFLKVSYNSVINNATAYFSSFYNVLF